MVPVSKVPESIWIRIFDYLPLNCLLAVRHVCLQWYSIETKVCAAKTTLKLFDQAKDVPSYRRDICLYQIESKHGELTEQFLKTLSKPLSSSLDNLLQPDMMIVPEFSVKTCQVLIRKFPNVENLIIYYAVIRNPALIVLLQSWNLKSLFLYPPNIPLNPFYPPYKIDWTSLWPLIDRLSNLKSLILFRVSGDIQLPSLSLNNLTLGDYDEGNLFNGLNQLGKSSLKCLTLSHSNRSSLKNKPLFTDYSKICLLDDGIDQMSKVGQLLSDSDYSGHVFCLLSQTKPEFASQITKLTLDCDSFGETGVSEPLIRFVCGKFVSLQSLNMSLKPETRLFDLLKWLRSLPHLSELGFASAHHHYFDISSFGGRFYSNTSKSTASFFSGELKSLPPLSAIRRLHLFVLIDLKTFSALSSIFPNLEQIEFDYSSLRCAINGLVYHFGTMFDHLTECGVCRNEMARILGRFPNLLPKCLPIAKKQFSL